MGSLKSDFLFPRMSFLSGAASVFALAGNFYCFNASATESEADAKALFSDWSMVGQDLQNSIDAFRVENKKQLELDLGL
jgi:hypothetical protein